MTLSKIVKFKSHSPYIIKSLQDPTNRVLNTVFKQLFSVMCVSSVGKVCSHYAEYEFEIHTQLCIIKFFFKCSAQSTHCLSFVYFQKVIPKLLNLLATVFSDLSCRIRRSLTSQNGTPRVLLIPNCSRHRI